MTHGAAATLLSLCYTPDLLHVRDQIRLVDQGDFDVALGVYTRADIVLFSPDPNGRSEAELGLPELEREGWYKTERVPFQFLHTQDEPETLLFAASGYDEEFLLLPGRASLLRYAKETHVQEREGLWLRCMCAGREGSLGGVSLWEGWGGTDVHTIRVLRGWSGWSYLPQHCL